MLPQVAIPLVSCLLQMRLCMIAFADIRTFHVLIIWCVQLIYLVYCTATIAAVVECMPNYQNVAEMKALQVRIFDWF